MSKETTTGKPLPALPPVQKSARFNQDESSQPSFSAAVEVAQGQVPTRKSMLERSLMTTHNKGN